MENSVKQISLLGNILYKCKHNMNDLKTKHICLHFTIEY